MLKSFVTILLCYTENLVLNDKLIRAVKSITFDVQLEQKCAVISYNSQSERSFWYIMNEFKGLFSMHKVNN